MAGKFSPKNVRLTYYVRPSTVAIYAILLVSLACIPASRADDDLKQRATWDWPKQSQVRNEINDWITTLQLEDEALETIEATWNNASEGVWHLQPTLDVIALADKQAAQFIKTCHGGGPPPSVAAWDQLRAKPLPPVVKSNLQLLYGKSLAIHQLYNEAEEQLTKLGIADVSDPATLLFYRAAARYRLRNVDDSIAELEMLLQRESEIPDRYATIAHLMLTDLRQLKPDSLDEIARIMDSIKVRLDHGRAGTRVRAEESEVIDKLSKMIEEKEKQLQQMQAASQSGGGGNQSNSPAEDSMLPGGGGPGDVDARKLGENTTWGNLPPKQREQALQELGKEFPSHYRDVIEEYFRNLAKDESDE